MNLEDMTEYILVGWVGFVVVMLSFGGFVLGRRYEQKKVEKVLPAAMDGVCMDCQSIGQKQGYKKGLRTCDDVLNNEDGRY